MKNHEHRTSVGFFWAWIDVLTCLLLVVYTLIAPPVHHNVVAIPTAGSYAITIDWPAKRTDDVDLWVQDPLGNIAYYQNPQAGLMNLEHDDIGTEISEAIQYNGHTYRSIGDNHERTIIRQAIPGEYTVNIYMYRKDNDGPVDVTVTVWYLVDATAILERHITLTHLNEEVTAFRLTVDPQGHIVGHSQLPKCLSCLTTAGGQQ